MYARYRAYRYAQHSKLVAFVLSLRTSATRLISLLW